MGRKTAKAAHVPHVSPRSRVGTASPSVCVRKLRVVGNLPKLLTTAQVAKLLYVSTRTVDNMRTRGDLTALPLPGGNGFRFPLEQPALAPFLPRTAVPA